MLINCNKCGALIDLDRDPLPDLDDLAPDVEVTTICLSCALGYSDADAETTETSVYAGLGV